MKRYIILIIIIFMANICFPCQFDTDCQPGSKCLKDPYSIYGVCSGGLQPGNDNDNQPVYSPTDPNGTYGDTCQFDTDCGPGSICLKSDGRIYGVCVKAR